MSEIKTKEATEKKYISMRIHSKQIFFNLNKNKSNNVNN